MSKAGGRNALIISALVVGGIRMWLQVRGKTKTPFVEWAIGWGATFFLLALLSEASPGAAGSLSLIIAVSDFVVNGVSLTTDVNSLVTGAESPSSIFVPTPFSTASIGIPQPRVVTSASKSPRENSYQVSPGVIHVAGA